MARSTPKKKRAKKAKSKAAPKAAPKARKAVRSKAAPKPSTRARGAQKARQAVQKPAPRTPRAKPAPRHETPNASRQRHRQQAAEKSRARTPPAKPTKAELRKLARKDWGELKKREQAALRSWRGQKAAKTVFRRRWERVAEELAGTHGREAREKARALIREEGSAGLARWLKEQSKLPKGRARSAEVRRRFAFWMYAP